jgi:hypothetical protein
MAQNDPHSESADAVHEGRPVEEQYIKQGRGGRRISIVMGVGIALTALGFFVLYLVFSPGFSATDGQGGNQAVDAAAFDDSGVPMADAPTTATGEMTNPRTGRASSVHAPTVQAEPSGS